MTEFELFIKMVANGQYRRAEIKFKRSMLLETEEGLAFIDALAQNPYVKELHFLEQTQLLSFLSLLFEKVPINKLKIVDLSQEQNLSLFLQQKISAHQTLTALELRLKKLPESCIEIVRSCAQLRVLTLGGESDHNPVGQPLVAQQAGATDEIMGFDITSLLCHQQLSSIDVSSLSHRPLTVTDLFLSSRLQTLKIGQLYKQSEPDYQTVLNAPDNYMLETLSYTTRPNPDMTGAYEPRFDFLRKFKKLISLSIEGRYQTAAELLFYQEHLQLTELSLHPLFYSAPLESFTGTILSQNSLLKKIDLYEHHLTGESVADLLARTSAEDLRLMPDLPSPWYKMSGTPSRTITSLNIRYVRYAPGLYEDLVQFVRLRKLRLRDAVEDIALYDGKRRFFSLPASLEHLDFVSNLTNQREVETILQLPNLSVLYFVDLGRKTAFGNAEAYLLSRLEKIRKIDISGGQITELGARALLAHTKLEKIGLHDNPCMATHREFLKLDPRVTIQEELDDALRIERTPHFYQTLIQFTRQSQAARNVLRQTFVAASHPKAGKNAAAARLFKDYKQPDLINKIFSWLP